MLAMPSAFVNNKQLCLNQMQFDEQKVKKSIHKTQNQSVSVVHE